MFKHWTYIVAVLSLETIQRCTRTYFLSKVDRRVYCRSIRRLSRPWRGTSFDGQRISNCSRSDYDDTLSLRRHAQLQVDKTSIVEGSDETPVVGTTGMAITSATATNHSFSWATSILPTALAIINISFLCTNRSVACNHVSISLLLITSHCSNHDERACFEHR